MNIKCLFIFVLAALVFLLPGIAVTEAMVKSEPQAQQKYSYSWKQTDSSLALLNHGQIVWQFNLDKKQAKPYFHPVCLIDGTQLTWHRPPDHPWHYGLWFSWKYINGLNYWEEDRKTGLSQGRTEIVEVKVWRKQDYSAAFEIKLNYYPPAKPAVLREIRAIEVRTPDEKGRYRIYWASRFTAGDKDVLLDRTPIPGEKGGKSWGGYAGLSVRLAKDIKNWQVIGSEGRKGIEAHGKKARWLDFSGETANGKKAGIAIFDFPDNLRHPSPWFVIMNPKVPFGYFSPAVLFNKPYTLPAGQVLELRYLILIHPGQVDKEVLESEWECYVVAAVRGIKLSDLGKALLRYLDEHAYRYPDSLRQLQSFIKAGGKGARWWLENIEYLGKGQSGLGPPDTVIAYDRTMLNRRKGTYVLFNDGHVDFKTPEQLKELGIIEGKK